MRQITIPAGKVRPNTCTRIAQMGIGRSWEWRGRFLLQDRGEWNAYDERIPSGTRMKLGGIVDPWAGVHGNSMRPVAWWGEKERVAHDNKTAIIRTRGVSLRAYVYRDGVKVSRGEEILWLPEDPDRPGWTRTGVVRVRHTGFYAEIKDGPFLLGLPPVEAYTIPRRCLYVHAAAHTIHGGDSEDSTRGYPFDITWEEER